MPHYAELTINLSLVYLIPFTSQKSIKAKKNCWDYLVHNLYKNFALWKNNVIFHEELTRKHGNLCLVPVNFKANVLHVQRLTLFLLTKFLQLPKRQLAVTKAKIYLRKCFDTTAICVKHRRHLLPLLCKGILHFVLTLAVKIYNKKWKTSKEQIEWQKIAQKQRTSWLRAFVSSDRDSLYAETSLYSTKYRLLHGNELVSLASL